MLSTFADIVGILSFAITVILLIRSESLRNEIVSQKINYRNQQDEIVEQLKGFRTTLASGEPLSLKDVDDMRYALEQYKVNVLHILSYQDRKTIDHTLKLFDKDFSDSLRKKLLKNLTHLCARFTKKEV